MQYKEVPVARRMRVPLIWTVPAPGSMMGTGEIQYRMDWPNPSYYVRKPHMYTYCM